MASSAVRKLDLQLGCFHWALRRVEDQASRYIAALNNPKIHVLGHPQTRIYNHREGLRRIATRFFLKLPGWIKPSKSTATRIARVFATVF